jgi:hypothetical protein
MRRELLDPLRIGVLPMENRPFKLIGKATDLVLIVAFPDSLQQVQDGLVRCVHG